MLWVPLALFAPLQLPLAVQLVGLLVADHDKFEFPPTETEMGLALRLTTGFGGFETVRGMLLAYPVPPALVQLRLYA